MCFTALHHIALIERHPFFGCRVSWFTSKFSVECTWVSVTGHERRHFERWIFHRDAWTKNWSWRTWLGDTLIQIPNGKRRNIKSIRRSISLRQSKELEIKFYKRLCVKNLIRLQFKFELTKLELFSAFDAFRWSKLQGPPWLTDARLKMTDKKSKDVLKKFFKEGPATGDIMRLPWLHPTQTYIRPIRDT